MTRPTWHACALCGEAVLTRRDCCSACRAAVTTAVLLGLAIVVWVVELVRRST